jgi:methyl-accepting chemotaxis protein
VPIRLKILLGALALTLVTALFGLYSRAAEQRLGSLSFQLYDDAFMAMSYLRAAQNGLLVSANAGPSDDAIEEMRQNLEVARDRAMSARGRQAALSLLDHLEALRHSQPAAARPLLAGLQTEFDTAVELFAGDAFHLRRDVGTLMQSTDRSANIALVASVSLAVLITLALGRSILPQLRQAVEVAQRVAAGRLDNVITPRGRSETARLLEALASMQTAIAVHVGQVQALLDEQALHHAEKARQQAKVDALVQCFGAAIGGVFRSVSAASRTVAETATDLSAGGEAIVRTGREAETQLAQSVASIAANSTAVRALSEALRDIGREAAQTEARALATLAETAAVKQRMQQTREAAIEIQKMVGVIGAIAGQTRMLALNVTIEAARAGAAGLGFSVLATEVKRLAQQVGLAAQTVAERGARIMEGAEATAAGIDAIDASAHHVHALSASIAASVATQDAAAERIWSAIWEVSVNAEQVRTGVDNTLAITRNSALGLARIGASAKSLAQDAAGLSLEVGEFLEVIRSVKGGETIDMVAVNCPATLRVDGADHPGRIVSGSGIMVQFIPAVDAEPGTAGRLRVDGLAGWLDVRLAGRDGDVLQLQPPLAQAARFRLQAALEGLAEAA